MTAATFILIALLKTSGEGGAIKLGYDSLADCEAAGERLETQFEALVLEDVNQNPVDGHPRVVWTCFDTRN
ncbi:MAG: hypothetical protein ACK4FR_02755 [Tabrizicola sp.]